MELKDPNSGEWDNSSMNVIVQALSCKHNVYVTNEIEKQYYQLFKDHKKAAVNIPDLYEKLKLTTGKVKNKGGSKDNFSHIPNEDKIKDEDIKFARLAFNTGALLVTFDGPLRDILKSSAIHPNKLLQRIGLL